MRSKRGLLGIPAWMTTVSVIALLLSGLTPAVWAINIHFVNQDDANATPDHPTRDWTALEKDIIGTALHEWNEICATTVAGNWTLRWEDESLFKKWDDEHDYSNSLGLTVYPGWTWTRAGGNATDDLDFPGSEIYFNTNISWFFDSTPDKDEEFNKVGGLDWRLQAVPGGVADRLYDLLSTAKHEFGHALGIIEHLDDLKGVMSTGRPVGSRFHLSPDDIAAFGAVHTLCPEPTTVALFLLGTLCLVADRRRQDGEKAE